VPDFNLQYIFIFYNFYIFSKLYWHRRRRNQIGFFFNNVYNNILIPKPKGQSEVHNPEKQETIGTRDRMKTNKAN
jgi:hypothetical protein